MDLLIVIGLTGGIASGKSTASTYLARLGAVVIDADKLGHAAYEPGTPAHARVIEAFGEDVRARDGGIDRKALGGKVFGDADALKRLTDIVWPEIRRLAEARIEAARTGYAEIVVLEAAVLFEAGWEDIGDEIWMAVVDRETAIARTVERDGVPREAVEARIDSQLTNEERRSRADIVLDNSGTLEELLSQLDSQWQRLRNQRAAS
ncbi:MAG: dephospho-CoA kinase [Pseudomonadales bacterium]|nr:dephospho-CoA kinase [Pseudomonadales bacterium]